jgi:hypothetical protein
MCTRGDMLRFAVAFALRGARKLVRDLRPELDEAERFRVADDVFTSFNSTVTPGGSKTIYRLRTRVTPHEDARTTHSDQWILWISRKITLYRTAKGKP